MISKPNILVIYYSQSGQLLNIIEHIFSNIKEHIHIDYCEIQMKNSFPIPWKSDVFFDAMPECVLQTPEELLPMNIPAKDYDLIVLGVQPWFLSPSIPINSFLKSQWASFLRGKNIITVVGARNMWLRCIEKVKEDLHQLQAKHVGNIVLCDTHPNLISLFTIIRWSFKGQKEAGRFLPEAGVQQKDIEASARFGEIILNTIQKNDWLQLQSQLLQKGAVTVKPGLVLLEKRGVKNFLKFATYIQSKGKRGDTRRLPMVKLFKRLLIIGIFVLSPISNFTVFILSILQRKILKEEVIYFKKIAYRKNAI